MINLKIEDAFRRKKLKEQLDSKNKSAQKKFSLSGRSSGDSNFFKKGFKKLSGLVKSKEEKT